METTSPFFGWDYPPSVCSPASYSRTLGLFVFGNQKSKRPPSGEALEGSDSHCLNYSALVLRAALGRRGDGETAQVGRRAFLYRREPRREVTVITNLLI